MPKLINLARMASDTTGTGDIHLTGAVAGCLTFTGAGVLDGDRVTYTVVEGAGIETGTGIYRAGPQTLTRTVTRSTNANLPLVLAGAAQVYIAETGGGAGAGSALDFLGADALATRDVVFQSVTLAGDLLPSGVDTSSIGSASYPFRAAHISEMYGTRLVEETLQVASGRTIVPKSSSTLALPLWAADTVMTLTASQTWATGDFLLLRDVGKVEYLKVVSGSGTTWTVTRNADGSGANDWGKDSVVVNLGGIGDGYLELYGGSPAGLSVWQRTGILFADTAELVRLGDLYNAYGTGANHRYGIGIGDYASGNYLSYNGEAAGKFLVKAGGGAIGLDETGIHITETAAQVERVQWATAPRSMEIGPQFDTDEDRMKTWINGTAALALGLTQSYFNGGINTQGGLSVGWTPLGAAGYFTNTGQLVSLLATGTAPLAVTSTTLCNNLNADQVDGKHAADFAAASHTHTKAAITDGNFFTPLAAPLTSTSWDGDSYSTTTKTLLDLSAVFSAPAGIKAALVRVRVRDSGSAAGTAYLILGPANTSGVGLAAECSGLTNDAWTSETMIVPCDANGDFYYQIVATGTTTFDVYIQIWGYWI